MPDLRGSLTSVAALTGIVLAWWRPEWLLILTACAIVANALTAQPDAGESRTWKVTLFLLITLAIKDFAFPGPWREVFGEIAPDLSAPATRQPSVTAGLDRMANLGVIFLAWPFLVGWLAPTANWRAWSLGAVVTSASFGVFLWLQPHPWSDYGKEFQLGTVASKNPAAGALSLGALLGLGLALSPGRITGRVIGALGFTLAASAAISLESRGAILGLALGASILLCWKRRLRTTHVVTILSITIIAALWSSPWLFARMFDGADNHRLTLAAATWQGMSSVPWGGWGQGNFEAGFALLSGHLPAEGMQVIHPDSGWILLFAEFGLGGLTLLTLSALALANAKPNRDGEPAAMASMFAVVAMAFADPSFHRPEILVLALPAAARLRGSDQPSLSPTPYTRIIRVLLALTLLVASQIPIAENPLAYADQDVRAAAALSRQQPETARDHYLIASALAPAHTDAIAARAHALTQIDPSLGAPLWRKLFSGASLRGASMLTLAMATHPEIGASEWMKLTEMRPELWPLLADSELKGAQQVFEQWLTKSKDHTASCDVLACLGAFARWGEPKAFVRWLDARKETDVSHAATARGGRLLSDRGRADLAWVWLEYKLPRLGTKALSENELRTLKNRATVFPDDAVLSARLASALDSGPERLALLGRVAGRANTPAVLSAELARETRAAGDRERALSLMQLAADKLAASQP